MTEVAPHEFRPMFRWLNRGRCSHCYIHEALHPINGWTASRPLGDKTRPGTPSAIAKGGGRVQVR